MRERARGERGWNGAVPGGCLLLRVVKLRSDPLAQVSRPGVSEGWPLPVPSLWCVPIVTAPSSRARAGDLAADEAISLVLAKKVESGSTRARHAIR